MPGRARMIDQTALPEKLVYLETADVAKIWTAIKRLQVRGAPAIGVAAAMRRAGFQPHDGLIYEALRGKGGVLVAVQDAPRAADALAVMQSYGGGNAAIGAWGNRV